MKTLVKLSMADAVTPVKTAMATLNTNGGITAITYLVLFYHPCK